MAQRAANQALGGERIAATYRCARGEVVEDDVPEHYLGPMDQVCDGCGSLNFAAEMTGVDRTRFSMCCQKGEYEAKNLKYKIKQT
jgi:hypothetical protein